MFVNPLYWQQIGKMFARGLMSLATPQIAMTGYQAHERRWDAALEALSDHRSGPEHSPEECR